jgi:hypothetical protein
VGHGNAAPRNKAWTRFLIRRILRERYRQRAAQKVHAFIDKIELLATDVVRLNVEFAEGCWLDLDFEQFSERSEN